MRKKLMPSVALTDCRRLHTLAETGLALSSPETGSAKVRGVPTTISRTFPGVEALMLVGYPDYTMRWQCEGIGTVDRFDGAFDR